MLPVMDSHTFQPTPNELATFAAAAIAMKLMRLSSCLHRLHAVAGPPGFSRIAGPKAPQLHRNLSSICRASSNDGDGEVEFALEEVTNEEAANFERIAANLVAKMEGIEDIPDGESIPDNDSTPCIAMQCSAALMSAYSPLAVTSCNADKQILVEFGANPDEVAEMQALLKGRASQTANKKAGGLRKAPSSPSSAEFSLAESTPRGKRRQAKIPDAFLPKVCP